MSEWLLQTFGISSRDSNTANQKSLFGGFDGVAGWASACWISLTTGNESAISGVSACIGMDGWMCLGFFFPAIYVIKKILSVRKKTPQETVNALSAIWELVKTLYPKLSSVNTVN